MNGKDHKTAHMNMARCEATNRAIDGTYAPADGGPYAGGKIDQKYIEDWNSQKIDCASLKQTHSREEHKSHQAPKMKTSQRNQP